MTQRGIFKKDGPFGSKYSSDSIFNQYGEWGSKYSTHSPFNPYAGDPPVIYLQHQPAGRLTKNRYIAGARDPDVFLKEIRESPRFRF